MQVLFMLFYLAAAVCFVLAALGASVRKINLVALGLLFWVLVPLIGAIQDL